MNQLKHCGSAQRGGGALQDQLLPAARRTGQDEVLRAEAPKAFLVEKRHGADDADHAGHCRRGRGRRGATAPVVEQQGKRAAAAATAAEAGSKR